MDAQRELVLSRVDLGFVLQRLETDYLIVVTPGVRDQVRRGDGLDQYAMDVEQLRRSYEAALRLNLDSWSSPIAYDGRVFEDPSALVAGIGSRLEVLERKGRWA